MGIIKKMSDVISANVYSILEKFEDPDKMLDQCLRNAENELFNIKRDAVNVIAEEKRCERNLNNCKKEINELQSFAMAAVKQGNDDDATAFLIKKNELSEKLHEYENLYHEACENSRIMKVLHDEKEQEYDELISKRNSLKAKMTVAASKERINSITGSYSNRMDVNRSEMNKIEEKINSMLDRVSASEELSSGRSNIVNLKSSYENQKKAEDVRKELDELKIAAGR